MAAEKKSMPKESEASAAREPVPPIKKEWIEPLEEPPLGENRREDPRKEKKRGL